MRQWYRWGIGLILGSMLLSFGRGSAVQTATELAQPTLHQQIDQALREEQLTGAVWSVVDGDSVHIDAAGIKNNATGENLLPEHRVHVGSITKTLVAVGILRLATETKLNLDTPVEHILPTIKFDNPWSAQHPVTIRHLLDHTSGLEDLRLWQLFSANVTPQTPLRDAFQDASLLKIRTKPGSVFSYSNMGYTLLGMIIEAVTGERYEAYLDRYLLQPLGMKQSTFEFVAQTGGNADLTLAMGHLDDFTPQPALPLYLRPAAQFTTTAYDMGLFLRFLMNDGVVDGAAFIDPQLIHAMGNPFQTESVNAGLQVGYSLGLQKRDRFQRVGLAHSGNIVGYHAMIYLFPEQDKAFFISHNTDSESANYERFNQILVEALQINQPDPLAKNAIPASFQQWEGIYGLLVPRFESLAYLDAISTFMVVSQTNQQFQLNHFQSTDQTLQYLNGPLFQADNRAKASHIFYQDQNNYLISDGFKTYRKVNLIGIIGLWINLLIGVLGMSYILIRGCIAWFRHGKMFFTMPLAIVFGGIMALGVPMILFINQSFTVMGDKTPASVLLALITLALPIVALIALWRLLRAPTRGWPSLLDKMALIALLQWLAVLGWWGLLPLRLWV